MKEDYTHIDLVQFLYREIPATEAAGMVRLLEGDPGLRGEYEALHEAKMQLPRDRFNPSPRVLNNILAYSRATAVEPQL